MKKLFTILALGLLVFSFSPQTANADCPPIYGGGQNCPSFSFSINKLVQRPGKGGGQYVDNLSINDPRYSPNQNVSFEIVVKNTGSTTIPTLTVVDTFPEFVSFVSGPGTYDSNNNTLTFSISNLASGQSSTYTVTGKVANTNVLPNQAVMCLLNQVNGTDSNGVNNSDSSQFCVEKIVIVTPTPHVFQAPKVVKTPPTGPEMLPLALLFPGLGAGFLLRSKSKYQSIFKGGEK